nr:NUDIX hydrolase [uncultured Celeribacter sp.]
MMSEPEAGEDSFDGAKIAILRGDQVLCLQRDDRPDIPFPGAWDLPGGGREGRETPLETVTRELHEELGLYLDPARIIYQRCEAGGRAPQDRVHFFVARWEDLSDCLIRLGDEGQGWAWFDLADFLHCAEAVPPLRDRLARFVASEEGFQARVR